MIFMAVENDNTYPFFVAGLKNHDELYFNREEYIEIETIKKATGLNWHDFILDAARLYNR